MHLPVTPPNRRRRLLLALPAAAALGGCDRVTGWWKGESAAGGGRKTSFNATDITGASFARQLELPDTAGRTRTLADWKGRVAIVFFGYTQCPDVCPATMVEVAEARKALGADGDKVEAVFVTVDPERDTPEILAAYMANFGPHAIGLRGSPEQIAAAAKEFKVIYAKVPGKTPGAYTMDHSAAAFVFDPQGRVRLYVPYGSDPLKLAADIRTLLAGA